MRKFALLVLIAGAGIFLLTGAAWADDFSSHYRIFGQLSPEKGDANAEPAPAAEPAEPEAGERIFGALSRDVEEADGRKQMVGMVGRPSSKALNSIVSPGDAP